MCMPLTLGALANTLPLLLLSVRLRKLRWASFGIFIALLLLLLELGWFPFSFDGRKFIRIVVTWLLELI